MYAGGAWVERVQVGVGDAAARVGLGEGNGPDWRTLAKGWVAEVREELGHKAADVLELLIQ